MRVTVPQDVLTYVSDSAPPGQVGVFHARIRDGESAVQLVGATSGQPLPEAEEDIAAPETPPEEPEYTSRLHVAVGPTPTDTIPYVVHEDPDRRELIGRNLLSVDGQSLVLSLAPNADDSSPVAITNTDETPGLEVIPVGDEVFERVSGIVDTDYLSDKTVTIVGAGTIGSTIATELAKFGVGTFYLFDPDHLEIHNVSRHVGDLCDVGRAKTAAVAERIKGRHPGATVHTYELDVTAARPELRDAIIDSDCVAICTDTQVSRDVINEEVVAAETPAVFGGAYKRAYGGQVVRVWSDGESPCHACLFGTPDANAQAARNEDGSIDYTQASDAGRDDFAAEPGLSVDVGFISLLQTRYVLDTLLEAVDRDSTPIPYPISMWGNRPKDEFSKHFEHRFLEHDVDTDCGVCGDDGTAARMRENLYSD